MTWELALSLAAMLAAYTASVVALVLWLTGKFRSVEVLIYREMAHLKKDYHADVGDMRDRVYKLEVAVFGVTNTGAQAPQKLIP